jgi:hypothetical protein
VNALVLLGVVIAAASIWGAAYLLSLWHEDRDEMLTRAVTPGWPLSRVIGYLAVAACIASNTLASVTVLRLFLDGSDFATIRDALQPLTLAALVYLDIMFTLLAVYLRAVRARSGQRPL